MIAILGRQYGQRRWTRFESDQFKALFGEKRVTPSGAEDAMPSAFDRTAGIGGATFDPNGDVDAQAREIADLCALKLDQGRPARTAARRLRPLKSLASNPVGGLRAANHLCRVDRRTPTRPPGAGDGIVDTLRVLVPYEPSRCRRS